MPITLTSSVEGVEMSGCTGPGDRGGAPAQAPREQHAVELLTGEDLTLRQRMVLSLVQDFIAEEGRSPTLREIGQHMGIRSTNGVADHLQALERKGYIRRSDLISRGIAIRSSLPALASSVRDQVLQENSAMRELLHRVLSDARHLSPEEQPKLGPVLRDIRHHFAPKDPR